MPFQMAASALTVCGEFPASAKEHLTIAVASRRVQMVGNASGIDVNDASVNELGRIGGIGRYRRRESPSGVRYGDGGFGAD
jgi:hypothetical protein